MIQEILCMDCAVESVQLHGPGPETKYPNEYVQHKVGNATPQNQGAGSYLCDQCLKHIPIDEKCTAFGIYTERDTHSDGAAPTWYNDFISNAVDWKEL